jgi:glucose-6-phosphate isomerase
MGGSSLGPEVIALTYKKDIFIFDSKDQKNRLMVAQ